MSQNNSAPGEDWSCSLGSKWNGATNRSKAGKTCRAHVWMASTFKHLSDPPLLEQALMHTQGRKAVAVNLLCIFSICWRYAWTSESRSVELRVFLRKSLAPSAGTGWPIRLPRSLLEMVLNVKENKRQKSILRKVRCFSTVEIQPVFH